ncbi:MAG: sterol desaturase family protein, partial [Deltaproteobacteria bacterium]|nr:sterol desaturase family protein [Deltaproteobacteria bacterium]
MTGSILAHEGVVRLSFFFAILIFIAVWESLSPRRPLKTSKTIRWYSNLGLVLIDTL